MANDAHHHSCGVVTPAVTGGEHEKRLGQSSICAAARRSGLEVTDRKKANSARRRGRSNQRERRAFPLKSVAAYHAYRCRAEAVCDERRFHLRPFLGREDVPYGERRPVYRADVVGTSKQQGTSSGTHDQEGADRNEHPRPCGDHVSGIARSDNLCDHSIEECAPSVGGRVARLGSVREWVASPPPGPASGNNT